MVGGWVLCFVAALMVGARALRRARPALLAVALPRYDRCLPRRRLREPHVVYNPTPNLHPSPSPSPIALT